MPVFISPDGNREVWKKKPEGYFTPEEWAAAHPIPEPTPEEILAVRLAEINGALAALDTEYLTARTLGGLALGDEFALAQYERHEAAAEPLRKERAELISGLKGKTDAKN